MQYDVETPAEYLEALEDDWRRETLLRLRELIREAAPELEERIRYKMLSYEDANGSVFGLNAQKGHVGLYVGNAEKVDPGGELLEGLDRGKGCIRFKKSVPVGQTRIHEFVAEAVRLRREGMDIEC